MQGKLLYLIDAHDNLDLYSESSDTGLLPPLWNI